MNDRSFFGYKQPVDKLSVTLALWGDFKIITFVQLPNCLFSLKYFMQWPHQQLALMGTISKHLNQVPWVCLKKTSSKAKTKSMCNYPVSMQTWNHKVQQRNWTKSEDSGYCLLLIFNGEPQFKNPSNLLLRSAT